MNERRHLDKFRLNRWLNIRKTTIGDLNKLLRSKLNFKITLDNCEDLDQFSINNIAKILQTPSSNLLKHEDTPTFLFKTKKEIEKSRRSIKKDGIHFYNYYTLPTPEGYIAPVILDILCPKKKLPQ